MSDSQLLITKTKLYKLLLDKLPEALTDSEANIMYELSKDKDVQKQLNERPNNRNITS